MINKNSDKLQVDVTITNDLGLHARAAAQVAKIAGTAQQGVWVVNDDRKVDAASVIDLLTLACAQGETITIRVDTNQDIEILKQLQNLVESGFGE